MTFFVLASPHSSLCSSSPIAAIAFTTVASTAATTVARTRMKKSMMYVSFIVVGAMSPIGMIRRTPKATYTPRSHASTASD